MKPKNPLRNLLLLSGSIILTYSVAKADTLYWDGGTVDIVADGNGLSGGTLGNWNTTLLNWDAGVAPYVAWDNANLDTAVFGGTAGTVTIDAGGVVVGGLTFHTSGYTLAAGTNGLTFGAGSNIVRLAAGLNSSPTANITGSVGGTGANMVFSGNPGALATIVNFNSANTTGWDGTTTINTGVTVNVDGGSGNRALGFTSGITLNGGSISTGSGVTSANDTVDFFSDTAAITVNGGGSITYRPINAGSTFLENIGAVTVNSGEMRFATGSISSGTATLAIPSISRTSTTSNLIFSLGNNGSLTDGNSNKIQVTGSGTTAGWTSGDTSNSIIGAWATSGTGAGADYAVYSGNNVVSANTIASDETNWTAADKQYTLTSAAGSAAAGRLSAIREITALRNTTTAVAATANSTNEYFTLAGNSFANGDVVAATGTGGLTAGLPYYVISVGGAGAGTFQLSTTPNGGALNLSNTTAGQIAGGITLSADNNLGTTGILNASAAALTIGGSGGAVTLPSTTSGNLFVNATAGAIAIDAPITNNGAGVLTLVTGGAQALRLSGANTYTGGTVINAGSLTFANAGSWVSGQNVTFGGTGSYAATAGTITGGTLNINLGAEARITGNSNTTYASTTGAGTLIYGGASSAALNLGDASGFTGDAILSVGIGGTNPRPTLRFSSIADTAGSMIGWGANGQGDSNQRAQLELTGNGGQLTFDNRQLAVLPRTASNNMAKSLILGNNNSNAAHTWVINTDFLNNSDRGGQALIFEGSNTGNNAFNGVIANSTINGAAMNVAKTGTGKWILSGDNTFTGRLIAGQGTLSVDTLNEVGVAGPLGMNNNIQLGGDERTNVGGNTTELRLSSNNSGTLEYTGVAVTSSRSFFIGNTVANGTGGGTIANNGSGAITFSAAEFNPTITGITATRTLTLGGANTGANEIQGVIQDNVAGTGRIALTKADAGTWTLSGDNTYTGTTSVSAGSLIINGNSSTATGAVSVAAAGTLGGIGTVGGNTALNGTLSPGQSPGTLTFAGDLTLGNGSTYLFEGGDLAVVGGTLGLNASWTLALGTGMADGGTVTIFDYATLGASANLAPTFDLTGLGFVPSSALSLTDTGTSIVLNGVSVIPEPSTALLAALGALALLRRRR